MSSTLNYGNFCTDFSLKIGNLIVLTKELLPSIKTTSYAKKIKLKVKAYAETTGIPFTDISPQASTMNHNNFQAINNENKNPNSKNNHHNNHNTNNQKSHTRHFSLPANSFHRRSNSSVTNNFPNQYTPDQKPSSTTSYELHQKLHTHQWELHLSTLNPTHHWLVIIHYKILTTANSQI